MSQTQADNSTREPARRRKVIITGAAGRIGSYLAVHSHERYELRLVDLPDADGLNRLEKYGEVATAALGDLERLKSLCQGMDTMVHLAANPSPETPWSSALNDNIIGTYNAFVAAKTARLRRVIYASSIHAVSGYPKDVQVKTSDPVNPGDLYGVTKCFGEALARYMAEQEGLSAIAIRIGAFQPVERAKDPKSMGLMDAFVSRRDLNQLIERCIDSPDIRFAIVHGISDNAFKRLDLSDTCQRTGYAPQDDLTEYNPKTRALHLDQRGSHSLADGNQRSGLREDID